MRNMLFTLETVEMNVKSYCEKNDSWIDEWLWRWDSFVARCMLWGPVMHFLNSSSMVASGSSEMK